MTTVAAKHASTFPAIAILLTGFYVTPAKNLIHQVTLKCVIIRQRAMGLIHKHYFVYLVVLCTVDQSVFMRVSDFSLRPIIFKLSLYLCTTVVTEIQ